MDLDFNAGAEGLAKANFRVPLCQRLLVHCCYSGGLDMCLTPTAMMQCNALIDFGNDKRSGQFLGFVNQMGAEIARNAGGDQDALQNSIESDVSFEMLGCC